MDGHHEANSCFLQLCEWAEILVFNTCLAGGYMCSKQVLVHLFQMECCGNNNYTDWELVFHNDSLPLSCCRRSHVAAGVDICNTASDMYKNGCLEQFGKFVMKHAAVLGGAGIGIAFIQVK